MKILKFSFLSVLLFVLSDCLYAQPRWQMTPPEDPSYTMQEICCTSDGNKIYGEAFMPKAPGKHPAVILSVGRYAGQVWLCVLLL